VIPLLPTWLGLVLAVAAALTGVALWRRADRVRDAWVRRARRRRPELVGDSGYPVWVMRWRVQPLAIFCLGISVPIALSVLVPR